MDTRSAPSPAKSVTAGSASNGSKAVASPGSPVDSTPSSPRKNSETGLPVGSIAAQTPMAKPPIATITPSEMTATIMQPSAPIALEPILTRALLSCGAQRPGLFELLDLVPREAGVEQHLLRVEAEDWPGALDSR